MRIRSCRIVECSHKQETGQRNGGKLNCENEERVCEPDKFGLLM